LEFYSIIRENCVNSGFNNLIYLDHITGFNSQLNINNNFTDSVNQQFIQNQNNLNTPSDRKKNTDIREYLMSSSKNQGKDQEMKKSVKEELLETVKETLEIEELSRVEKNIIKLIHLALTDMTEFMDEAENQLQHIQLAHKTSWKIANTIIDMRELAKMGLSEEEINKVIEMKMKESMKTGFRRTYGYDRRGKENTGGGREKRGGKT